MSKLHMVNQVENTAIEWLTTLSSKNVSPAQEQEFMRWLEASPLHQAAYIKAEQLWQRGIVLARLPKKVTKSMWHFTNSSWVVACACLFAVSFGFFTYLNPSTNHYAYQTAIGELSDVTLEDGSHISLNTNSQLKVEFNRRQRTVYLTQGEVFFEVKKDGRPFDIITRDGVVRVVGTRFSVYQTSNDTIVTVAEGRVALGKALSATNKFVPSIVLQANQRLSLQTARTGQLPEKLNANAALAWRTKQLVFKGLRLSQVLIEIARYFPETIILDKPEMGEKEITAVIQLADIKTTLQALAQSLDMHAEFDASNKLITLLPNPTSSTP